MSATKSSSSPSLLNDYIPKEATQQIQFLKKYPKYDGRGILIAIIDSGIDVSSPGLQKTSTGLPKIFDCFDFSGLRWDINTSTIKKANNNNILDGLSGRKLKIPISWKNPLNKWHLGKASFEALCYRATIETLIKNQKNFQEEDSATKTEALKTEECNDKGIGLSTKTALVDCIVWHDGEKWRVCIDTSFGEDLEKIKILTNFRDEHEYTFISENKSYCVTISNNGNLLNILYSFDEHGTVVANIAASHSFSSDPNKDGFAPGAQIISMH